MIISNKKTIAAAMPLLASNEGIWEGWYRYYETATGKLVDQHRSRLICRLPTEGEYAGIYHQTNYYYWDNGKTDIREFPAWYENGRIWWDNDLIKGWCAQMQPDDNNLSTCLNWTRKDDPDMYLYEMIQNSANGIDRARVWQWFRNSRCFQRTLIDEKFITTDWQGWTDFGPPKN